MSLIAELKRRNVFAEEILKVLAAVDGLRVASRTSSWGPNGSVPC
jgi:hypothetical protein